MTSNLEDKEGFPTKILQRSSRIRGSCLEDALGYWLALEDQETLVLIETTIAINDFDRICGDV